MLIWPKQFHNNPPEATQLYRSIPPRRRLSNIDAFHKEPKKRPSATYKTIASLTVSPNIIEGGDDQVCNNIHFEAPTSLSRFPTRCPDRCTTLEKSPIALIVPSTVATSPGANHTQKIMSCTNLDPVTESKPHPATPPRHALEIEKRGPYLQVQSLDACTTVPGKKFVDADQDRDGVCVCGPFPYLEGRHVQDRW